MPKKETLVVFLITDYYSVKLEHPDLKKKKNLSFICVFIWWELCIHLSAVGTVEEVLGGYLKY